MATDSQITEEGKAIFRRIPATIIWIKHDEGAPLYYKAVPLHDKKHKVVENKIKPENGHPWYCQGNNQFYDNYIPRFILTILAADQTASQFVNVFDDFGSHILGCEAIDVERYKESADPNLDFVFEQPIHKRFLFKIRAKVETYGDDTKLRFVLSGVEQFNYIQQSHELLEKIKLYH